METTDRCIHCNALLPETMLVPAYCEDCEDDWMDDEILAEWETQDNLYTSWETLSV